MIHHMDRLEDALNFVAASKVLLIATLLSCVFSQNTSVNSGNLSIYVFFHADFTHSFLGSHSAPDTGVGTGV